MGAEAGIHLGACAHQLCVKLFSCTNCLFLETCSIDKVRNLAVSAGAV